jgi:hypothetical protein
MKGHCESCERDADCLRSMKDGEGNISVECCRCQSFGAHECEDCEALRERAEKLGVPESEIRPESLKGYAAHVYGRRLGAVRV